MTDPGLNRLLEISSEKAGYVLVKNYDRIGRNSFDVIHWIKRLEAGGKKLLSMESNEAPSNIDLIYQTIRKYNGI